MNGMARGSLGKKIGIGALLLVIVGLIVLFGTSFGKGLRDVTKTGVLQDVVKRHENGTFVSSGSAENLKALGTGLKQYESSEGQYPDADRWMDQLLPRVTLNNLPKKEARKKFIRPDLSGGDGAYGFAMNDAAAGKYHGDLPKGTVLVFESNATGWNAHGDPKKDGRAGGSGLTVEGTVVPLG